MARYASTSPVCPPIRRMSDRACGLLFSVAPMPLAAAPSTTADSATPSAQPARPVRCSRQARVSGLRSQRAASARPGRAGTSPAPRSRRLASTAAAATSATVTAAHTSSSHQRGPAYGWTRSIQPSGDTQLSQPQRGCRVAHRAQQVGQPEHADGHPPGGPGALGQLGAVTAATPANMQPARAVAAPRASEPAAG